MARLTKREDWEKQYINNINADQQSHVKRTIKDCFKKILGGRILELSKSYDDYLLWDVVLEELLIDSCSNLDAIEIGSAPGKFMTRFYKEFGGNVFGVEYSEAGSKMNRRIFSENGINPDNVISIDFFSKAFLNDNENKYDIVISRGFIEHFTNGDAVIKKHYKLLNPNGLLIILIPNLCGIYGLWTKIFNPTQIPLHNINIMKLANYRQLFNDSYLKSIRCSYFGTFSFWLFTSPPERRCVNRFIKILLYVQRMLNIMFRLVFGKNGFETSIFSPNLIYIGNKKIQDESNVE